MKKRIFSIIAVAALILGFNACTEDYLDTVPTDQIATASAFETVDNAWSAINGVHRSLYIRYESQGQGGMGGLYIINDMLGEDLVMTSAGNGWYNNIYKWVDHINPNDGDNLYPYRVYYRMIANVNMIIGNIDNATGDPVEKDAIKGQALAYRAFFHYQLVQLYGERYVAGATNSQLGVPIMTDNSFDGKPRATVEEVYQQINDDLDEAIALLDGYNRANNSHLDMSVAQGLKARVALTMGRWADAATYANDARTGYTLMDSTEYMSGFRDYTNPEWMWGSRTIEDHNIYFADFFAYMSRNFSSTNIRTNPKAINALLYAQIPATDVRSAIFDPTGQHIYLESMGYPLLGSHVKKPYTSQKFLAAGNSDSRGDLVHMRAAEMYLIEAEALARGAGTAAQAAQVLFDLVSQRDPAYTLSTNTGQALIDEILLQRRIELWGEGFRFLDLKRLNAPLDRTGANHDPALTGGVFEVPAGDPNWQWAIPQSEIDANPALKAQMEG